MVLVQIWPFLQHFFSATIRQESDLQDILDWKNAFLGNKNKKFKNSKIDIFPKGLTHGFGPNMTIFPIFFFKVILVRKMTFTIIQNEKTPFQGLKTRSPKCRKIEDFPKGLTHGFGPKLAIFRTFFFIQYRPGK